MKFSEKLIIALVVLANLALLIFFVMSLWGSDSKEIANTNPASIRRSPTVAQSVKTDAKQSSSSSFATLRTNWRMAQDKEFKRVNQFTWKCDEKTFGGYLVIEVHPDYPNIYVMSAEYPQGKMVFAWVEGSGRDTFIDFDQARTPDNELSVDVSKLEIGPNPGTLRLTKLIDIEKGDFAWHSKDKMWRVELDLKGYHIYKYEDNKRTKHGTIPLHELCDFPTGKLDGAGVEYLTFGKEHYMYSVQSVARRRMLRLAESERFYTEECRSRKL